SSEVSALTQSILNCERRIAALSRQDGMMKELRHSLDTVFDEDASSAAAAEFAWPAGAGRG
ncbi:hypothetical protein EN965_15785, partial [Mesorhizobium sp. M7A.F.Ca.CA.001.05.1.1]